VDKLGAEALGRLRYLVGSGMNAVSATYSVYVMTAHRAWEQEPRRFNSRFNASSKSPVSMTDAAQEQENPGQTLDACSKGSALAWKRERERMIAAQARRGSTSQEPGPGARGPVNPGQRGSRAASVERGGAREL
jgi:hypothetical protein